MINNVVFVSGVQQSDSVIHIHVSILFQIFLPFRLLHNMEQSSLCSTVGPCWLFILSVFTNSIYSFMAALGLHCCSQAFSRCSEREPLFIAVYGLLTVVVFLGL